MNHTKCTHPEAVTVVPLTDYSPIFRPQYRIKDAYVPAVNQQISEWAEEDVIEPAAPDVRWNSSLMAARKKDGHGTWSAIRTCIDPRPINARCSATPLPIPDVPALFDKVAHFYYYTTLDMRASFTQFPVAEQCRDILTFIWEGRRWRFKGAPYGLTFLPGHFQRVMNVVLADCMAFVTVFIDDICIFSRSLTEHIQHVTTVIECLNKWSLRLKPSKCYFGCRQLLLLGHLISGVGRSIDPSKLDTLSKWPLPQSSKDIMTFLGFTNYLRDYLPHYATIAAPLDKLRHLKKDFPSVWASSPTYEQAFT